MADEHSLASRDDALAESEGHLHFAVDAQILFQIGEQLVARHSIALAELIKNGYDADAREVTVLFENVRDRTGGTITVQDDGVGMTLETIRDHWMRIATANKLTRATSTTLGRPLAGAKGVGRFAARKLGDLLQLHTVAEAGGRREQTTAEFDWVGSFQPGQDITRVEVPYLHGPTRSETGTVLEVVGTRDPWSETDIERVRNDLVTLVNPFRHIENADAARDRRPFKVPLQFEEGRGFDVRLETPEFPDAEGSLVDLLVGGAWCSLAGHVVDGRPVYRLKIRETGEDLQFAPEDVRFEEVPDASFLLFYFPGDKDHYDETEFSFSRIRSVMKQQGGVRVYLDGFRVYSYGQPGDDWLEVDATSARRTGGAFDFERALRAVDVPEADRPTLLLPRSNQLFGTVELAREAQPGIIIKADRESLVDNRAFAQLRSFVQTGLAYMTVQYARVSYARRRARREERRQRSSSAQIRDVRERAESLSALVGEARKALPAAEDQLGGELAAAVADLTERLSAAEQTARHQEDEQISERSMLRVLASAGTIVGVINHQLQSLVAQTRRVDSDLATLAADPSRAPDGLLDASRDVSRWREQVERQLGLLGLLLAEGARERRRRLALYPIVEGVRDAFRGYTDDFEIIIEVDVPKALRTPPFFQAELSAVLFNALSNAFKFVLRRTDRRVRVEAHRSDSALFLRVLDTGTGVLPADRERVFEPFFTTSVADPVLGVGTGLGLTVVRDIVGSYGGTARFTDAPGRWATCLEVEIPYP